METNQEVSVPLEVSGDAVAGRRIHMLMWDSKLSQRKLAPLLGMTQANLSKKVRGERGWSIDDLLSVSRFFGVSVSYLVGESENRHPDDPNGDSRSVVHPPGLEPGTH